MKTTTHKFSGLDRQIIMLLKRSDRSMFVKELYTLTTCCLVQLGRRLKTLLDAGYIERPGRGTYRLTAAGVVAYHQIRPVTQFKQCQACHFTRPLRQFRLNYCSRGGRRHICNRCLNPREAQARRYRESRARGAA
jgi:hypothetical protein